MFDAQLEYVPKYAFHHLKELLYLWVIFYDHFIVWTIGQLFSNFRGPSKMTTCTSGQLYTRSTYPAPSSSFSLLSLHYYRQKSMISKNRDVIYGWPLSKPVVKENKRDHPKMTSRMGSTSIKLHWSKSNVSEEFYLTRFLALMFNRVY